MGRYFLIGGGLVQSFLNKSIRDLENIHRDNLGDVQIRKELLHELKFRSTARASNLKSQISDQVTPPQPKHPCLQVMKHLQKRRYHIFLRAQNHQSQMVTKAHPKK